MEIIILAGGLGTRLKGLVNDVPKPMADISGTPFLKILLDCLHKNGFKRVIISICYLPEKISDYFGSKYKDMEIIYNVESKPLGTGGATKECLNLAISDDVFIINGDTFLDINYKLLYKLYKKNYYPLVTVREVKNISRYGEVILKDDFVYKFNEKTGSNCSGYINAGCYIFPKDIFADHDKKKTFSLEKDFLHHEVKKKKFQSYISDDYFIDIGVPFEYNKAQSDLKKYVE